eukprot:66495-Prorocentrum_minimum.AAC.1
MSVITGSSDHESDMEEELKTYDLSAAVRLLLSGGRKRHSGLGENSAADLRDLTSRRKAMGNLCPHLP